MIDRSNEAMIAEMNECFAAAGYPGVAGTLQVSSGAISLANAPLHPASLQSAKDEGLGLVSGLHALDAMPAAESVSPSEAGPGPGELDCGPTGSDIEGMQQLNDSYSSTVLSQPSIKGARAAWADCMGEGGYDVSDIYELRTLLLPPQDAAKRAQMTPEEKRVFDEELLKQERDAAESVVSCDESAYFPVIPKWADAEKAWMDENAEAIRQLPDHRRFLWAANLQI